MKKMLLIPQGGLCNRLRAIASAKRVASLLNFELYLFWNWGDYNALFENDNLTIVYKYEEEFQHYFYLTTKMSTNNGKIENQKLNISSFRKVIIHTCHIFSDVTLPEIDLKDLKSYLPKPSRFISEKHNELKKELFENRRVVGVHIRRTDHIISTKKSPDRLFIKAINEILDYEDCIIFLCSDNKATLEFFSKIYGDTMITFNKSYSQESRWPRPHFDMALTIEDYLELLLLSSCTFILGSYLSSYSEVAIAMNSSQKNKTIED